ncbi:MAG: hypothetical protein HY470_00765 [Candidatus Ryanbacteria bacterium]|nr:hypothetical protein [Candidatus Ryanbacteria bacterium]
MQVVIEKKLDKKIRSASKTLGVDKKLLVERALNFYLDTIKQSVAMRNELDAWERLSDESFYGVDYGKR